jgi:ribosomal protein L37AE/L43A
VCDEINQDRRATFCDSQSQSFKGNQDAQPIHLLENEVDLQTFGRITEMTRSKRGEVYLPAPPRFKPSTKPHYRTHFRAWACPRCELTFPTEEHAFEHLSHAHEARRVWDSDGPDGAPPAKEVNPTSRVVPKAPKVTPPAIAHPIKRPHEEMVSTIAGPDGVKIKIRTVDGIWYCPACHERRGSSSAISRHLSANCPGIKNRYEQPKEWPFKREGLKPQRVVSERQQCRALGIRMEDNLSSDDEDISRLTEVVVDASSTLASPEPQLDHWIIVPGHPNAESDSAKSPGFPTKFLFKLQRKYQTDKRRKLTEKLNDDNGEMDDVNPLLVFSVNGSGSFSAHRHRRRFR